VVIKDAEEQDPLALIQADGLVAQVDTSDHFFIVRHVVAIGVGIEDERLADRAKNPSLFGQALLEGELR